MSYAKQAMKTIIIEPTLKTDFWKTFSATTHVYVYIFMYVYMYVYAYM